MGFQTVPPPRIDTLVTSHTPFGTISGVCDGQTIAWLGLRYATARRWEAPQMVQPWNGTFNATTYAPSCAQSPSWEGTANISEDCLFVNVWMPANSRPKGTIIYIHGGSFRAGSIGAAYGGSLAFNGSHLAASRGVVVATLQYRLGIFGTFAHGGNLNIRDQQVAIRFLRGIVEPAATERVLLVGHSAGANFVCAHLTIPSSHGLFTAAVMLSGTCATVPMEAVQRMSRQVAVYTSCGGSLEAPTIACLRNLTVEQILQASRSVGVVQTPSDPMLEPSTVPTDPAIALSSGSAARVPVIFGNAAEEAYWAFIFPGGPIEDSQPISFQRYELFLRTNFCPPLARVCGPSDVEAILSRCE